MEDDFIAGDCIADYPQGRQGSPALFCSNQLRRKPVYNFGCDNIINIVVINNTVIGQSPKAVYIGFNIRKAIFLYDEKQQGNYSFDFLVFRMRMTFTNIGESPAPILHYFIL